jgi:hypothetical protein
LACYGLAHAFCTLVRCQTNVLQMYRQLAGNLHAFWDFFFCILVAGIYVTKVVTKCLQFVYIFADILIVKCLTKFSILAVKCLTNCLQFGCILPVKQHTEIRIFRRTFVWQVFKLFKVSIYGVWRPFSYAVNFSFLCIRWNWTVLN